jgi:hypothetical protein
MITKMKNIFKPGEPIKREPFIKIRILFMLMDMDHFQFESIKITKPDFDSDAFKRFMMYASLCLNCGPRTKGGVEGFGHIENISVYFDDINDGGDSDNEYEIDVKPKVKRENRRTDNKSEITRKEITMNYPGIPEYYSDGYHNYKFDSIDIIL